MPTHKAEHTLDLVISRASSSIISTTDVYDASISNHFSVLFNLIISDPSSVPKVTLARDMRSFSYTKFKDDLSIKLIKIPLQQDPNTLLLQHYELAVGSALDIQAPIKSGTMKCRLRYPWYNGLIHLAREIRRANENKWKATKLEVHRQIYVEHRKNVNAKIKQAKMDSYESEFATEKQDACFRVIKELTQGPGRMLPTPTTEKELERIIRDYPRKTCSLDHCPSNVLKKTLQCQLSYLVALVNSSFDHGKFPFKLRTAVMKPLLKKENLDLNVFKNYRPVSNIAFISKVLEQVAVKRLTNHLDINGLPVCL